MALQAINLYHSYRTSFDVLSDAEFGRLLRGAIDYAVSGEEPVFRGNEKIVWGVVRDQINRDQEAYAAKCAKNRANASERYRTQANAAKNKNKDKNKDKDKENIESRAAARFSPPTLEDVAAYCRERGNAVDPQRFIDYYTANGWVVGKNRMKDWRAAVRTWEGREKKSASRAEEIFAEVCGL